ncbi:phosphonate transport system permease protein [Enhydrobacter aerosaccus]|uniref:Phosphonate transport system permease protein n=1 Tax=Enhydrobacter aerosaccus TaxID=225324 RepID=A0A1T4SFU1_9HYPH|nr:phosphonate ABC transporter, permease protein PhnE [Enhydrobacter aerosaccus]SKA27072.1 phosphonate transport system permease protein [Enhydrobacter aerosaccus]
MPDRRQLDVAALRTRHPQHFGGPGRERPVAIVFAGMFLLLVLGMANLGFFQWKTIAGIGKLWDVILLMLPPDPGTWSLFQLYFWGLVETIAIALLGTLTAAVLALPLSLLAARNVTAARLVNFLTRRSLDTIRSVDILIWALIWIGVVGLGPFAGVLAFATSDIGSFGKLFSEALETADHKPVEGILSTGGGRLLSVRFGILPQVFPVLASQILYFFESNVRWASVLGVVGAGGIGLQLAEAIRTLELQQASFIILMILVAVAMIDFISSRLRFALIGRRERTS